MMRDLPVFDDRLPNCNAYQFGKQNRISFFKSTRRASPKLQLIHTDVGVEYRHLYKLAYITFF